MPLKILQNSMTNVFMANKQMNEQIIYTQTPYQFFMYRQYMSRDTEMPPIQEDQVVERHRETNMLTSRDPSLQMTTVPVTVSMH